MSSYSQILAKNILLGFILSVIVTVVSIYLLTINVTNKQDQILSSLETFTPQLLIQNKLNDAIQILQKNYTFNLLVIKKKNNEGKLSELYRLKKEPHYSDLFMSYLTPKPLSLFIKEQSLSIQFKINYLNDFILLIKIISAFFVSLFIFILYSSRDIINKQTTFLTLINKQISTEMSLNIEKDGYEEDASNRFKLFSLKDGIEQYQKHFQSQVHGITTLQKVATSDSLTQVNNRGAFVQYFQDNIGEDGSIKFGALLITRCSELQTINQIHGYHEGDRYINKVANIMKNTLSTYPSSELFRLNSSDFATVLPNVTLKVAEEFAKELSEKFNEYQQVSDFDSVAYSGIVSFDKDKPLGELLALADTGISIAQTQHINAWYAQKDTDILSSSSANYGNQNWRQEIDNVLENQRVTLLVQAIKPNSKNSKVYGEILARFLNSNDEMLPTASFLAMAEKLDKIVAVDRLIIETAINEISNKNFIDQSFGINISARSIHDEHFLIWLERRLLREPSLATMLVFEITEYGLQQNIKTSKRFIDMIHRVGARVTVERFGVGLTSFKFFRELKPDFIKMDSTYTRDIDDDKNNQYFLRLMVDLAHRLSVNVLAESVESQQEKHTLEKLFIDGCQGFYIGKPTAL